MDNNPTPAHMGWKKPTSVVFAALLFFGAVVGVMAFAPNQAYAAVSVTQDTPKIFGSALGRVMITDTAMQGGSTQDTITVNVEAKRGTTSLGSVNAQVKEIGTSSGQFELFVTTANSPFNPAAPTFDSTTPANAHVVRINTAPTGDGVNDAVIDLNGASAADQTKELKDGDSIVVTYGGQQSTILFQKTIATVSTDRTIAGNNTLITVRINDPDANNDPTLVNTFTASSAVVKAAISGVDKASFVANATFAETGQNSGVFEHTFKVGGTATTQSVIDLTALTLPQSVTFQVTDHDVYAPAPTGAVAPYNAAVSTTSTPSASVTLRNDDGLLGVTASITMANGIQLQVTDPDRNVDTAQRDTIDAGNVTVTVAGVTGTLNGIRFKETGDNTGIFVPDITDNRIAINLGSSSTVGATSITLDPATIADDRDITITYNDPHGDSNGAETFTSIRTLSHTAGALTGPGTSVGVTGTFSLTLNEPDLNTNTNSVESYTVTFPVGTATSTSANLPFGIGGFTAKARGSAWTPTTGNAITMTFIETGANTGIFTATNIEMQKINNVVSMSDGDQVEFKYTDNGESPAQTSTITISIGKPGKSIEVSRTTIPIPRASTTDVSKVILTVTDPSADSNPGSTDTITVPAFQMTKKDGSTITTPLMTGIGAQTLTETGVSTGVFTVTLNIGAGTESNANMDNAKLKITYGDVSTSITLRSYDGVVTSSASAVSNGQNITITVSDQDLNRDPAVREKIGTITLTTKNDAITGGGVLTINDAEETGADTGVFVKTVTIGKDIKVGDLANTIFGTEIEVKYTDLIASDISTNVSRDLTLNVKTASGSIDITPAVVGPGTKVAITVNDNDLNTNPQGTDRTTSGQEYIRVTSDRSGVNTLTTAVGEETGTNTGKMKTTLTLTPLKPTDVLSSAFGGTTKDITGKVLPGDIISIRYTDQADASGNKVTVSKTFKITSQDPLMNVSSTTVAAGNSFSLTVTDLDANTDGEAVDSVTAKVTSDSDVVGTTVTLLETGPNTGVFTGTVSTSTGVNAGSITVKTGDNVYMKYNDKYPADYADRVKQVVDPSKDFTFVLPIGASAPRADATSPSNPVLKDFAGQTLTEVTAGQQVFLSTAITNNQDTPQPFAAIVEVRDADGITVYLQWQQSTLTANGKVDVGLSWTPDAPGTYTVRTFVVNNISSPQALSPIAQSTITVS
ncbi:hypothetical protein NWT39_08340 [Nitrososphaera viennensis]|nr:hypothetical protein [Nitrososphaera viennensis]UVS67911.1 hypothetical protein NWT39_08340 [Nitrososphaera viennensis]